MSDSYPTETVSARSYLTGDGPLRDALEAFGLTPRSTEAEIREAAEAARAEAAEEDFTVTGDMAEAFRALIAEERGRPSLW